MRGHLRVTILATLSLVSKQLLLQDDDCEMFQATICESEESISIHQVANARECQLMCNQHLNCTIFSFNMNGSNSSCSLLSSCLSLTTPCISCITGPPTPNVDFCERLRFKIAGLYQPLHGFDELFGNDVSIHVTEVAERSKRATDDNDVNIDDGLLDEVFDELPENVNQRRSKPKKSFSSQPKSSNEGNDDSYYCVMGGNNGRGAVSTVSVMDVGKYQVPRQQLISPFPSFMTHGNGQTFSVYSNNGLYTCTPGYQVTTLGFHRNPLASSYVPGSCNQYNFNNRQWSSTGGQMTQFRDGGSSINVGSYIMTLGGRDQFGRSLSTVELFDPRRPHLGWHNVPKWRTPSSTRDQCTVVTRDPTLGSQIMVLGGLGQERSAMKLVLSKNSWLTVPSMLQPRSQHSCSSITLNGRPGVVVSGGVDRNRVKSNTVEFFDINTNKWVNLPGLARGRRSHTMTVIDGKMAVSGGVATGFRGEDDYLDDVEVFDGRQWQTAKYRLDQPRFGANLVKIPIRTFYRG